jgi:hypothetical protein
MSQIFFSVKEKIARKASQSEPELITSSTSTTEDGIK